mgnify:CR=1 FL=1
MGFQGVGGGGGDHPFGPARWRGPGGEHKEPVASAPRGGAAGGITAMVCLPNTQPTVDDVALIEFIARRARETGVVKIYAYAAITRRCEGAEITEIALANPDFAGLHFTGSTATFQGLWQEIGLALPNLRSYPRVVGETGGKDFVGAHPDGDRQGLLVALLRGSFEDPAQKCAAASPLIPPPTTTRS